MRHDELMLAVQVILVEHQSGLYTAEETVNRAIDTLLESHQRDRVWSDLPNWVRQRIDEISGRFATDSEVMTFGHAEPKDVRDRLAELKRWREASRIQQGKIPGFVS